MAFGRSPQSNYDIWRWYCDPDVMGGCDEAPSAWTVCYVFGILAILFGWAGKVVPWMESVAWALGLYVAIVCPLVM